MARLLGTFTLYLLALTLAGSLINTAIAATIGVSIFGSAVAIVAQLLATMWSGALHARRSRTIPAAEFIWRAAVAMTLILGLVWATVLLLPFSPWGSGLGGALLDVVRDAIWVFLVAGMLIITITLFGTRYVLRQTIQSVVAEEEQKIRDTF